MCVSAPHWLTENESAILQCVSKGSAFLYSVKCVLKDVCGDVEAGSAETFHFISWFWSFLAHV